MDDDELFVCCTFRDVAFLLLKFELGGNINLLLYNIGMSLYFTISWFGYRLFKYITW